MVAGNIRGITGFNFRTSAKHPMDYEWALCNKGSDNGDVGYVVLADKGEYFRGPYSVDNNGFNQLTSTGVIFHEQNRAANSCTQIQTNLLKKKVAMEEGTLLTYHRNNKGGGGNAIIDEIKLVTFPPSTRAVIVEPTPTPTPTPPPTGGSPTFTQHYITLNYLDVFGLGDAMATKAHSPFVINSIDRLLPNTYTLSAINVDTQSNLIEIHVTEQGNNILPVFLAIIAVFAVILVIRSYAYKEVKGFTEEVIAVSQFNEETLNILEGITKDENLTDAEKVAAYLATFEGRHTIPTPTPPPGTFPVPDIPEIVPDLLKGGGLILVGLAALMLAKK